MGVIGGPTPSTGAWDATRLVPNIALNLPCAIAIECLLGCVGQLCPLPKAPVRHNLALKGSKHWRKNAPPVGSDMCLVATRFSLTMSLRQPTTTLRSLNLPHKGLTLCAQPLHYEEGDTLHKVCYHILPVHSQWHSPRQFIQPIHHVLALDVMHTCKKEGESGDAGRSVLAVRQVKTVNRDLSL